MTYGVSVLEVLVPADTHRIEGGVLGQGRPTWPGEADRFVGPVHDDL